MSEPSRLRVQQIILEIIRQAGGEIVGKTKLNLAFYLSHLLYADNAPDYLSDWPMMRLPRGPGIADFCGLIRDLTVTKALSRYTLSQWPFQVPRYRLTQNPLSAEPLGEEALNAICQATTFILARTPTELSDWTHEFCRSWIEGKDGEELNIYIDLIPEDEYEERQAKLDVLSGEMPAFFGGMRSISHSSWIVPV